jgi:hypothetical protein
VSVVLPTYERRVYARRAVDSVLAQRYRDFELIVVDDGSTDGTDDALAGLGARLHYHWQPNRGVSAARNAGIRLARGEIVAFLDSDDRWRANHLEVVTAVLDRHPEAVLVCTAPGFRVRKHDRPSEARLIDALPQTIGEYFLGPISCTAVRRSAVVAAGGYDEALSVMENTELFIRLAALGPFALLEHRTVVWQTTTGSLVERTTRRGDSLDAFELIARRQEGWVRQLRRPDRQLLIERSHGKLRFAAALRALAEGDEAALRPALADACRLLPELRAQPELVPSRIDRVVWERTDRSRLLGAAADAWPFPQDVAALFLRARAILAAGHAGQLRAALGLARRWPLAPTPRFLVRTLPLWRDLLRATIQARRHRGRESAQLLARLRSSPDSSLSRFSAQRVEG